MPGSPLETAFQNAALAEKLANVERAMAAIQGGDPTPHDESIVAIGGRLASLSGHEISPGATKAFVAGELAKRRDRAALQVDKWTKIVNVTPEAALLYPNELEIDKERAWASLASAQARLKALEGTIGDL